MTTFTSIITVCTVIAVLGLLLNRLTRLRLRGDRLSPKASQREHAMGWALTVLVLGAVASVFESWEVQRSVQVSARADFENLANRISFETERRFEKYVYGLRGTRGVYAASKSVERGEFQAYVASHDLPEEFPGALGFGYIQRVNRQNLATFIEQERADEAPWFKVQSDGNDPEMRIIKFIEPLTRNRAAVGLDVAAEAIRRDATERAMLSGKPALSGAIELVQDSLKRPGFLYVLPVLRKGSNPQTPQERREATVGWVYAPVILDEALNGLGAASEHKLRLEIRDITDAQPSETLYHLDTALGDQAKSMFSKDCTIEVGGRRWNLHVSTLPIFDRSVDNSKPAIALIFGLVTSGLLGAIVRSLGQSRSRAIELADAMTRDLRASEQLAHQLRQEAEATTARLSAYKVALDRSAIVAVTDPSGKITEVNDAFCTISGYSREDLIDQDHRIINSGAHPKSFWVNMWKTVNSTGHWHAEVCNRAKDGSLYWVDTTISAMRGSTGKIEKLIAIRTDVSERKRAEMRLEAAQSRLQSVLDCATEMFIIATDPEGTITVFNRGAEKLLGYTAEEMIGRQTPAILHDPVEVEKRASELTHQLGRPISGFETFIALPRCQNAERREWTYIRKDGSRTTVEVNVTTLRDSSGSVIGFLGTGIDISDRKQAEFALEEARIKADDANRAKSEFLANMSHEIRTPLTAVLGYAEVLRDDLLSQPGNELRIGHIDTIRNAGNHLMTVINDILDLSKIEAGKMTVESVDFSLMQLLNEVESLMRPRASGKGIKLEMKFLNLIPNRITSDPTRLRQILLNLIGNAVKFTEAGQVLVEVSSVGGARGERLRVDVVDTGSGMTDDQAKKLFNAFSQADNSVTRKHGGTGLGLIICQRLAMLMDGNVTLLSTQAGVGSTFRVELALNKSPGAILQGALHELTTESAQSRPTIQTQLTGRILLVEDGIDNQRLIAMLLRKAGAVVELADNGRIALRVLSDAEKNNQPFDLIVTDMQMPEMDGYTLAATLRAQKHTIPIIALTAHAMAEDKEQCLRSGCNDFASKPVHRAELLATCARWIGKTSAIKLAA